MIDASKRKKILYSFFFFFLAGLCEIGGEDMSWILGAMGGFVLFLYGIVPTFQPTPYFHRIYAAYGGVFIVMALLWGLIFDKIVPDLFDIVGAIVAIVGIIIIFYVPRRGEESLWSKQH